MSSPSHPTSSHAARNLWGGSPSRSSPLRPAARSPARGPGGGAPPAVVGGSPMGRVTFSDSPGFSPRERVLFESPVAHHPPHPHLDEAEQALPPPAVPLHVRLSASPSRVARVQTPPRQRAKSPKHFGSRKRNRMQNDRLVGTFAQDAPSEEELNAVMNNCTSSHFAFLFQDPQALRNIDHLMDISPDQQAHLLRQHRQPRPHQRASRKATTPQEMAERVNARCMGLLRRTQNVAFVCTIERTLLTHFQGANGEIRKDTTISLKYDPYHRLLAHGVCQYYGFKAQSVDTKQGDRLLRVAVGDHTSLPNELLLSQYLPHLAQ